MEKLRREWVDNGVLHWEPVYSAAEVDVYRAAVRVLVERISQLENDWDADWPMPYHLVEFIESTKLAKVKAIAAVERLEVE